MKLLVLTSEPISAQDLRNALPREVGMDDLEVMVLAPALQDSPLKFWVSDADDAIARAEEVRRTSVEQLGDDGVAAGGDTGESDPLTALQDALVSFPADRIMVFTPRESAQRYLEDVDPAEIEQRFGLPVDRVPAPSSSA